MENQLKNTKSCINFVATYRISCLVIDYFFTYQQNFFVKHQATTKPETTTTTTTSEYLKIYMKSEVSNVTFVCVFFYFIKNFSANSTKIKKNI